MPSWWVQTRPGFDGFFCWHRIVGWWGDGSRDKPFVTSHSALREADRLNRLKRKRRGRK